MKNKIKRNLIVLVAGIVLSVIFSSPSHAKDFDYGFFGATKQKPYSKALWADYPYIDDTYNTVSIFSDGLAVLRTYDNRGRKLSQTLYELNGTEETIEFEEDTVYAVAIQLVKTTGTVARLTNATTTNPNAENINFYEFRF